MICLRHCCLSRCFGRPRDDANWIIDEGGCCIWYDEPDLIKKVETRIGMPMKVMDPEDFSVPGVLESPLGEAGKKRIKKETVVKEPPSRRAQMRKKEVRIFDAVSSICIQNSICKNRLPTNRL
ncbi:unnamed protein product [Durusdinium trenchii]|uniref:Uncharacterized protein n=1 Tax=Durusdinium trenchii TaxID=1381693 RepID=A0ABP0LXR0_9DINO